MSTKLWRAPIVVMSAMLASLVALPPATAGPTPPPTIAEPPAELPPPPPAETPAPVVTPTPRPSLGQATARSTMIAFSWAAVPGAAGYRVQLTSSLGGTPLAEQSAVRTAAVFSGLKPNTSYWARVVAVGADGLPVGQPSPELQVTTPYPLAAPVVQAAVRSSIRADLSWVKPPKGVSLHLEWTAPGRKPKSTRPKGTRLVRDELKPDTTYQVRARLVRNKTRRAPGARR